MKLPTPIAILGLGAICTTASPIAPSTMAEILGTRDIITNITSTEDVVCNRLKCVDMIAAAGCVAIAAAEDLPASLMSCVAGNTDKLCDCGMCMGAAANYLTKHGIC